MINLSKSYFSVIYDTPRPWSLYFQDSTSPQMEGLTELHDDIMFYLVIILLAVGWIIASVIVSYVRSKINNNCYNSDLKVQLLWPFLPLITKIYSEPRFERLFVLLASSVIRIGFTEFTDVFEVPLFPLYMNDPEDPYNKIISETTTQTDFPYGGVEIKRTLITESGHILRKRMRNDYPMALGVYSLSYDRYLADGYTLVSNSSHIYDHNNGIKTIFKYTADPFYSKMTKHHDLNDVRVITEFSQSASGSPWDRVYRIYTLPNGWKITEKVIMRDA